MLFKLIPIWFGKILNIKKPNTIEIVIGKKGTIIDTFSAFTKPMSKKLVSTIDKELKS